MEEASPADSAIKIQNESEWMDRKLVYKEARE
jgi:hypothetical protein